MHSGGRFVLGGWLDAEQTLGLEAGFLFMGKRSVSSGVSSDGSRALAIPYLDATTGLEAGYMLGQTPTSVPTTLFINTTPDVFVGLFNQTVTNGFTGAIITTSSSQLQGSEANAVLAAFAGDGFRAELLAGFRYVRLDERITIASTSVQTNADTTDFIAALGLPTGMIPIANSFTTTTTRGDQFDTHNFFYGGQIGARGEYLWGMLSLQLGGKLALGYMSESANVTGATTQYTTTTITPTTTISLASIPVNVASGAPPVTTSSTAHSFGGFFAQPSNMGHFNHSAFAVVPEANLKAGLQLTDWMRVTVGYTFLYMSDVMRPGDQIDRTINPNFLTIPAGTISSQRPLFPFKSTDYYAQGVDFGIEFRY
jgi:hypothetical protein